MVFRTMLPIWTIAILVSGTARADPPTVPTKPSTPSEGAPAPGEGGKDRGEDTQHRQEGQSVQGSVFTDRDGDGIQDGQEHRFRKPPRYRDGSPLEEEPRNREMRRLRLGPGPGEGREGKGKGGETGAGPGGGTRP